MKYLNTFEKKKWIKEGNTDLEEVRFIFDPLFDFGFRGIIKVDKSPEKSYSTQSNLKREILSYCNGHIHIGLKFSDQEINLFTTKKEKMMRFQNEVNDILSEIHDTRYKIFIFQ